MFPFRKVAEIPRALTGLNTTCKCSYADDTEASSLPNHWAAAFSPEKCVFSSTLFHGYPPRLQSPSTRQGFLATWGSTLNPDTLRKQMSAWWGEGKKKGLLPPTPLRVSPTSVNRLHKYSSAHLHSSRQKKTHLLLKCGRERNLMRPESLTPSHTFLASSSNWTNFT